MYFLRSVAVGVIGVLAFSVAGGTMSASAASLAASGKRPSATIAVSCKYGSTGTGGLPVYTSMKITYDNPTSRSFSTETTLFKVVKDENGKNKELPPIYDDATVKAESKKTVVVPLKLKNLSQREPVTKVAVVAALHDAPIAQMDWVKPLQLCGHYQGSLAPSKVKLNVTSTISVKVVYGSKAVTRTEVVSIKSNKKIKLEIRGAVFWKSGNTVKSQPLPKQTMNLRAGGKWKITVLESNGAILGEQRKGSDYSYRIDKKNSTYGAGVKTNELNSDLTPWWRAVSAAEDDR